jgi:hypothetical protein
MSHDLTIPAAGEMHSDAQRELRKYKDEIREAQQLLDFAISQSASARETPIVVADAIVKAVKEAEQQLLATQLPDVAARTTFELAYRDLAQLVAPVTTRSLRDTSEQIVEGRRRRSAAAQWNRQLWLITSIFLAYIVLAEVLDHTFIEMPVDEESSPFMQGLSIISHTMNLVGRYMYGALGACVYLLRSLHIYIYRREFNTHRIHEYWNRIVLGLVSGGAISLFVNQLTTADGVIALSEAALAFLAGYSSDFLFRAIERVIEAILPKVGIETVKRAGPLPVTASVSLSDLLNRLSAATSDEEKALLRELIGKVKDRM